jgi:hypothetical protein
MARMSPTTRDHGFRQVKTATKWLAGGAAVLTGFFAVWEARSVHDASATTPTPALSQSGSQGTGGVSPAPGDGGSYSDPSYSDPSYSGGDLRAPEYAPAPSYQPPAVSSGGS